MRDTGKESKQNTEIPIYDREIFNLFFSIIGQCESKVDLEGTRRDLLKIISLVPSTDEIDDKSVDLVASAKALREMKKRDLALLQTYISHFYLMASDMFEAITRILIYMVNDKDPRLSDDPIYENVEEVAFKAKKGDKIVLRIKRRTKMFYTVRGSFDFEGSRYVYLFWSDLNKGYYRYEKDAGEGRLVPVKDETIIKLFNMIGYGPEVFINA